MGTSDLISVLHSELNTHRFSNGWQLTPGRSIEPLCFRILALRRNAHELEYEYALSFIESLQRKDGAWPAIVGDEEPCAWTTALAVLVLMTTGRNARLRGAVEWLIQSKGREANWFWCWRFQAVDNSVKFDPAKYGWSWIPGTTSWVIPTAFSLIALEKAAKAGVNLETRLSDRISLGMDMLLDRMCPGGGWNAGNSTAFGVSFTPYIDATAAALLALHQRDQESGVRASLSWLTAHLPDCRSPYSLAWGILGLTPYGRRNNEAGNATARATDALVTALGDSAITLDASTIATCALALEAIEGDNVFEVRR
jgi:hypothetical protein